MLIDTHCHLNDLQAFPNPFPAIERALAAGVERMVVVGIDVEWSDRAITLAEHHPSVFASVGHHPNSAATFSTTVLEHYRERLTHPKVVALGEIGLDYYWNTVSKEDQLRALYPQLELAEALQKPIIFHCRDAYDDLLDILSPRTSGKWLLHCFGGDEDHLARALEIGCWIGVDGPVTYKNAENLRKIIQMVPKDKLLIETDAPWMTPVPHRGKPNEPAYLPYVAKQVEELGHFRYNQNALEFFEF